MRNLTEPMKRVLRIMAEGQEIGQTSYDQHFHVFLTGERILAVTVDALRNRGLIERSGTPKEWPYGVYERYRLTETGRRAAGGGGA